MDELKPYSLGGTSHSDIKQLSELLKSIGFEKRLIILFSLFEETVVDFNCLKINTDLGKTALANHLINLEKLKLIRRIDRGKYSLTNDGRLLLQGIVSAFRKTSIRTQSRTKRMNELYARSFKIRSEQKAEVVVDRPAEMQLSWNTYYGSIAGVIQSLGGSYDTVDIAGYSGLGFIVNTTFGMTGISGPNELGEKTWNTIIRATERLGFKIDNFYSDEGFPSTRNEELTDEEILLASKLFDRVKRVFANGNHPLVLWGIAAPEYGIINGYKNNDYLVSSCISFLGRHDAPIHHQKIKSIGFQHLLSFGERTNPLNRYDDKNAIIRGIQFGKGDMTSKRDYESGPKAYAEWIYLLENESIKTGNIIHWGNSYCAACLQESKKAISTFLNRLENKYQSEPQKTSLGLAAKEYFETSKFLQAFSKKFPFIPPSEIVYTKKKQLEGAEFLRKAMAHEEMAIVHLEEALKNWE